MEDCADLHCNDCVEAAVILFSHWIRRKDLRLASVCVRSVGVILIDQLSISSNDDARSVASYVGDLAAIPAHEAVDLLVVSAFPDDYAPTSTSLIGALYRNGVSVEDLAKDKAVDLRHFSSCWLSQEIYKPGLNFKRILCFEPRLRGSPPEIVGDVFRSLIPFCNGRPPLSEIAMPLLAAGDQGESPIVMLDALLDAAFHWFTIGLSLKRIRIVIRPDSDQNTLAAVFSRAKARLKSPDHTRSSKRYNFDAFLSYSRNDQNAADCLHTALTKARPSLRLFVDRLELQPGAAWQQHIFEALDDCHKVIPLLSPCYTASKVCKEEFNIALFRHRDTPAGVLLPIQLRSTNLPTYMKLVQFIDVREGDHNKLLGHLEDILKCISQ